MGCAESAQRSFKLARPPKGDSIVLFNPRKRKPSDASLQKILCDPLVNQAFTGYMRTRFAEEKLAFWTEVNSYEKIPYQSEEKRARATIIYNKFIRWSAPMSISVDNDTKLSIEEALLIDDKYQVKQEDGEVLRQVYLLAFGKVYQELKYEYMPSFLKSRAFMELHNFDTFFEDEQDAVVAADQIANDINVTFILDNPYPLSMFTKFLLSPQEFASHNQAEEISLHPDIAIDLIELIAEADDFAKRQDKHEQFQRFTKIMTRFCNEKINIAELNELFVKFEKKPGQFTDVSGDILDQTKIAAINRLGSQYFEPFKASRFYKQMLRQMSASNSEKARHNSIGAVEQLHDYQAQNVLAKTPAEIFTCFNSVLDHHLGVFYVKKFARSTFQEESVLFCIEVKNFQMGNFATPSEGTFIIGGGNEKELMDQRAHRIFQKYLKPDAPLEINISAELRESIVVKLGEKEISPKLFDESQQEILKLLQQNSWAKFNTSLFYKELVKKFTIKNQHYGHSQKQKILSAETPHSPAIRRRSSSFKLSKNEPEKDTDEKDKSIDGTKAVCAIDIAVTVGGEDEGEVEEGNEPESKFEDK